MLKWIVNAYKAYKMSVAYDEIRDYYESIGHESPVSAADAEIEMRVIMNIFIDWASDTYLTLDVNGETIEAIKMLKNSFIASETCEDAMLLPKELKILKNQISDMDVDEMLVGAANKKLERYFFVQPEWEKEFLKGYVEPPEVALKDCMRERVLCGKG